mgnify:CR=1 FL=1
MGGNILAIGLVIEPSGANPGMRFTRGSSRLLGVSVNHAQPNAAMHVSVKIEGAIVYW